MEHDKTNEDTQETAALYSLGALCQHDARVFEAHLLEGCAICLAEKRSFDDIVTAIGTAQPSMAPPAYVRDLLMSRVQRETNIAQQSAPAAPSVVTFPERRPEKSVSPKKVVRESPAPARRAPILPWALAATLLIFFIGTYLYLRSDRLAIINESKNQIEAVRRQSAILKDQLAQFRKESAAVNEVVGSPGFKTIDLQGQQPAPSATAKVYWNTRDNRWVVTAQLPPAPAGKTYQLWFVTASEKISAGLIQPDETGHGFIDVPFPVSLSGLAAAAITLEPEGGSAQPTMPIYAVGKAG